MPEQSIVECPSCNARLRIDTESMGRQVECSKCQTVFASQIPVAEPIPLNAPPQLAKATGPGDMLACLCPGCGACGRIDPSLLGDAVNCPKCSLRFKVELPIAHVLVAKNGEPSVPFANRAIAAAWLIVLGVIGSFALRTHPLPLSPPGMNEVERGLFDIIVTHFVLLMSIDKTLFWMAIAVCVERILSAVARPR